MEIKNKTVLITGANGLVGLPAVRKCIEQGAQFVYAADIKIDKKLRDLAEQHRGNVKIIQCDLTYLDVCENLFKDQKIDIVLHIAGVKGSPARSSKQPCDYLFPMLMFNTNMMKASFDANVDWFVYLSSVGVYQPAEIMREDDVWQTVPSKNDWYPGWTKRMGEATLESLRVQYGWDNWTVIRPSNIYGINDNFAKDATVISSNIWKLFNIDSDQVVCWGDGSSRRDFVFADDVAQAAIDVVAKEVRDIINFGCGEAISIKQTIESIIDNYHALTGVRKQIVWDTTQTNGDPVRCLDKQKQILYDILPHTGLDEGIKQTIKSYMEDLST